jgi:epoxide hydrolase-like predicted phosphatase
VAARPVKALVIDIGDVFFPFPPPSYFTAWAESRGIPTDALARTLWHSPDIEAANVGAITAETYIERTAARLGVDADDVRALIEGAFADGPVDPKLVAYVRSVRPSLRVVALTNNWSFARRLLAARGLMDLFDHVVISAEEGVCKPDARAFRVALARAGADPDEAVFVDDSLEHIAAARALGLRAVHFVSTDQAVAEIEAARARSSGD